MPALKTCGRSWNVGTDDFTLPAIVAVLVRLVCIGLTVGVLVYLFVGPEDCPMEEEVPPFLYGSLFALVIILLLSILNENIIFSISLRGSIMHKRERRKSLAFWLFLRIISAIVEFIILLVCTVAVFGPAPFAAGALECVEYHDGPLIFAQVVVVAMIVVITLYVIGFSLYLDPCGLLCSPSVWHDYESLYKKAEEDKDSPDGIQSYLEESRLGRLHRSHYGYGRIFWKIRGLCCCQNTNGNRSRTTAMQEMALAFHTLFSDSDHVTTDLVAGLILLSRYQKGIKCQSKHREGMAGQYLHKEFSQVTFDNLPCDQKPPGFQKHPMRSFDPDSREEMALLDDLVYYMHYAMGIYGWPLHVFDNLCCGLCQICSVTCCACNYHCCNELTKPTEEGYPRVTHDNCCLCGVGTIRLQTKLPTSDLLYVSYENKAFVAPFSICSDSKQKAIVLTVRGTLSIDDILTDLAISMVEVEECHRNPEVRGKQFVHKGMYTTASLILKTIEKHRLLEKVFANPEYKDYKLVVTGHSLGAGVASVLSVILKKNYPHLKCYAFSPPGCIFSFPLTYYSRDFTTSVVLGNDMIPRVTMQSLFYMKWQIDNLLRKCRRPKLQVLCTPRIFDRFPKCVRRFFVKHPVDDEVDNAALNKELERKMMKEAPQMESKRGGGAKKTYRFSDVVTEAIEKSHQSESEQIKPRHRAYSKTWRLLKRRVLGDDGLHEFVRGMGEGEQIAGFPPGKVLHIHVEYSKAPWLFHHCFKDTLELRHVNGEDMAVILVDRGMMDDHLPNNVLTALKRCQREARNMSTLNARANKELEVRDQSANGKVRGQNSRSEVRSQSSGSEVGSQGAQYMEDDSSRISRQPRPTSVTVFIENEPHTVTQL